MPLIIGLTGTIAAGKSTVAETLVELGAVHADADKLMHREYDPGTPGFDRVVAEFGEDIVGADGYVDRKVLGAKVFGNRDALLKLSQAIGSTGDVMNRQTQAWRQDLGELDVAVLEVAGLMEPGYGSLCDQVWLVGTADENALARLQSHRGLTADEAQARIDSAYPLEPRRDGADWLYMNDGSLDDLRAAVKAEFNRIRVRHQSGELTSVYGAWYEGFKEKMAKLREAQAASGGAAAPQS